MKKFLITILVVVFVALGACIIWLATLDGKYDVKRSITINKANSEVFNLVKDFNHWKEWSPWLCMEPDAKVKITGNGMTVGDTYSWEGELLGQGTMKHLKIETGKIIEQDIAFLKPMKSESFVYWEFKNENDSTTKVTWGMKGEMPFVFRFMTKMMEPMIGMDYDRGLKMLKDLSEKGYIASKVEVIGEVDAPEFKYIGERNSATFDDADEKMKASFMKLSEFASENQLQFDKAMSLYHEFDLIKGYYEYTAALPIKDDIEIKDPFYIGDIAATKALKIKFTGDYEHLGNAWSTGMSYMRTHKLKEKKGIPSYELYLTNPMEELDEKKWVTELYFPIN